MTGQSSLISLRILVYGAGAVGQAFGCLLAADGHAVDLIVRERYADPLRNDGLAVTGIFGDHAAAAGSFGAITSLDEVRGRVYDFTLVTTKAHDTAGAADDIARLGDHAGVVVSLQNGCGNIEQVTARFGPARSLAGRVITGFEIERPGLVRITVTADDVHIGAADEGAIPVAAEVLARAIDRAGLPCRATPYVRRDLCAKLLYNCALNPLGAILGVRYGLLGEHPATRAVIDAVIGEVFAVLTAMNARTHWETPDEYREYFYGHQLPATAHHRPSMLQDIEQGKRTEVDALTGYVASRGRERNIPTPVCDTLSAQIRFLEVLGRPRATGDGA